jgi:hypothetical protein
MKSAIRVRPDSKKLELNWINEITQNPYFLRPEFLPSGRATPETAKWKIEDDLLRGKEDRGWRSGEERCELRK